MTQTLAFTVTGEQTIHCSGCEERISKALHRLPGIHEVQASSQTQRVVVTINPDRANSDQVRSKLEQMGYQVISSDATG